MHVTNFSFLFNVVIKRQDIMANLRRHFNFNAKASLSQEPFNVSSCKASFNDLDKQTLMNDICNCLDLCCSYVQVCVKFIF